MVTIGTFRTHVSNSGSVNLSVGTITKMLSGTKKYIHSSRILKAMSFILDANYVITLDEVGILDSLLNLRKIIIPKMIVEQETKYVKDFQKLVENNKEKFTIIDASHEQKSQLLNEIASALKSQELEFLLEVEDQCDELRIPEEWSKIVNVFLIANNSPKPLKNVLTNSSVDEFAFIKKTEEVRVLEHSDVHLCALGLGHRKCYILSMDAGIWSAFLLLDPTRFQRRVIPIFRYLALVFKDDPIGFIDVLIKTIKKRHTFAKDILGKLASLHSTIDLEQSVDNVLYRHLAEMIKDEVRRRGDRTRLLKLWELKDEMKEIVRSHITKSGNILSFDEAQFIKDLNRIKDRLRELNNPANLDNN